MRKSIVAIAFIAGSIITGIVSCESGKASQPHPDTVSKDSLLKRGEYLVTVGGCDDCHSPKKMGPRGPEIDMEHRFSGFPANRPYPKFDSNMLKKGVMQFNEDLTSAAGPWGITFSANLTSDQTGLGKWSEGQFVKALREGKWKGLDGTRPLLPPMPWQNIGRMTDEDLRAVFTFLQSTKPVSNVVPTPKQFADLK